MDLYIYYTAAMQHAAALQAAVGAMQADLARHCGAAPQLKRRPQDRDGLHTWMEVYPGTGDGFDQALSTALAQADLGRWISGARHTEQFLDVQPCV